MARITAERAVDAIGNRYDLVLVASRRVRELSNGHAPRVDSNNNPVVTALREIEAGEVGRDYLHKSPDIHSKEKKSR